MDHRGWKICKISRVGLYGQGHGAHGALTFTFSLRPAIRASYSLVYLFTNFPTRQLGADLIAAHSVHFKVDKGGQT